MISLTWQEYLSKCVAFKSSNVVCRPLDIQICSCSHNNLYLVTIHMTALYTEKWSWFLSLRLVVPGIAVWSGATIASHPTGLDVWFRIIFWQDGLGLYIFFGDWANALEFWRSPSLRLVKPGIAVSPGASHFDSRIVVVTGAVVKHQPTPQFP